MQDRSSARPLVPTQAASLLYLPNEDVDGDQLGPRAAFEAMVRDGTLARCQAYSFLVEAQRRGASAAIDEIVTAVGDMQPDLLLWQHVGAFPLTADSVQRIRRACPGTRIVYHEGDAYGRWAKPFPLPARLLIAQADIVALVGRGSYADLARRMGARKILYSPSNADLIRFAKPWMPTSERRFDVVLIGNRVSSRRPWGRMPGARRRMELARSLGRKFGPRFGLFGANWEGFAGYQGPVAYADQEDVQRAAWVSAGWSHFDNYDGYFSDRLPISLLSGIPHVTNHQPGYDQIFGPDAPFSCGRTVEEVVAKVEALLAIEPDGLQALGERAQEYCKARFTAEPVFRKLIAECTRIEGFPSAKW